MTLRSLCVKINLGCLYNKTDDTEPVNWDDINSILVEPLDDYLKNKTKIHFKSMGIHDFNEKGVPHLHINYIVEALLPNPTANYKYYFSKI